MRVCSVKNCTRRVQAKGLCQPHYSRRRRHGDVRADVPVRGMPACAVGGCDFPVKARGLCVKHYARLGRYGDPLGGGPGRSELIQREGPKRGLRQTKCAVPSCNGKIYGRIWCQRHYERWLAHGDALAGGPRRRPRKRTSGERLIQKSGYALLYRPDHPNARKSGDIYEHVFIMSEAIGRALLPGETVHHKNGKRADNRISNLELWASVHPRGQRVRDLVEFANEIIARYGNQPPGLTGTW
jgi:hypothetical protein